MSIETTENGISYDWYLAGPDGAHFILKPGPERFHDDIDKAKAELRRDRDVVSIRIERQHAKKA